MEQNMTGMTYKIREMAQRIRELREITGLTTQEMAERTGVSQMSVSRMERAALELMRQHMDKD